MNARPPPPPPHKPQPSDTVLWEETVVPLPNATGNHELNVYIRFMSVNRSAAAGHSAPATLYFNTYTYAPSLHCAFDGLAGKCCRFSWPR